MKTIKLILIALFTFLLFFAGCMVNISVDQTVQTRLIASLPDEPSMLKLISIAVLSVYEVVVRVIPSVGDYSVVSWIIKALKNVSDTLNISK